VWSSAEGYDPQAPLHFLHPRGIGLAGS